MTEENHENVIQYKQSLGRDFNPGPPKYEADLLTTTFGEALIYSIRK
jgi:hypothetical protein